MGLQDAMVSSQMTSLAGQAPEQEKREKKER
jgi:hypothetical protein